LSYAFGTLSRTFTNLFRGPWATFPSNIVKIGIVLFA